jgi:hypothetical protein
MEAISAPDGLRYLVVDAATPPGVSDRMFPGCTASAVREPTAGAGLEPATTG